MDGKPPPPAARLVREEVDGAGHRALGPERDGESQTPGLRRQARHQGFDDQSLAKVVLLRLGNDDFKVVVLDWNVNLQAVEEHLEAHLAPTPRLTLDPEVLTLGHSLRDADQGVPPRQRIPRALGGDDHVRAVASHRRG